MSWASFNLLFSEPITTSDLKEHTDPFRESAYPYIYIRDAYFLYDFPEIRRILRPRSESRYRFSERSYMRSPETCARLARAHGEFQFPSARRQRESLSASCRLVRFAARSTIVISFPLYAGTKLITGVSGSRDFFPLFARLRCRSRSRFASGR